ADAAVFAACELVAIPMCHAGWHAVVAGDHTLRGIIAILIGAPIGIAGASFHWWKDKIGEDYRQSIHTHALRWWPVAILLAAIYAAGPEIYERAAKARPAAISSLSSPTSDEISQATDPLKARISELRAALEDMTRQRNEALKQHPTQTLPPPNPDGGPITWQ